jgi:hypothetical protein
LYPDAQLDIEILEVRQTYEEDQELESTTAEDTGSGSLAEAEEAFMAVAAQNQAPV